MGKVKRAIIIERTTIEKVQETVSNLSDEALTIDFDEFFSKQPEICEFVTELMSESGQQARDLCLFLSYLVYKAAVEATSVHELPTNAKTITEAYKESRLWIDKMSGLSEVEIDRLTVSGQDGQFHLLGFVIGEINMAIAEGLTLNEQEQGKMLFILKTVISSLTWNKS